MSMEKFAFCSNIQASWYKKKVNKQWLEKMLRAKQYKSLKRNKKYPFIKSGINGTPQSTPNGTNK